MSEEKTEYPRIWISVPATIILITVVTVMLVSSFYEYRMLLQALDHCEAKIEIVNGSR